MFGDDTSLYCVVEDQTSVAESLNHFRTFPQIPYFRSLKIKPECQTRSNALEMSQNINRTSLPRSRFFYNSIIYC
jgi:hypothetical protein